MMSKLREVAAWLSQFAPGSSFLLDAGDAADLNDPYGNWQGVLYVEASGLIRKGPQVYGRLCAHSNGKVLRLSPVRMPFYPDQRATQGLQFEVSCYECHTETTKAIEVLAYLMHLPVWSCNGEKITLVGWPRDSTDDPQLLSYDLTSDSISTISHDWRFATEARWLKDDTVIANVVVVRDEHGMKHWRHEIRHFDLHSHLLESRALPFLDDATHYVELSPTGKHISFLSYCGAGENLGLELHIHDIVNGTSVALPRQMDHPNPVWSPDGSTILYFAFDIHDNFGLRAFNIVQGEEVLPINIDNDDCAGEIPWNQPRFLDGNRYVAISVFRHESDELIVADLQSKAIASLQMGIRLNDVFVLKVPPTVCRTGFAALI